MERCFSAFLTAPVVRVTGVRISWSCFQRASYWRRSRAAYHPGVKVVGTKKWTKSCEPTVPVSQEAARSIGEQLANVWSYLRLAVKHSRRDIEHVHRLRVATRRAVAAIQLYKDCLPRRRANRIKKLLIRVRRAAGDARDLDVLCKRLSQQLESGSEDARLHALKKTRRRRNKAQKPLVEAHRRLKRDRFNRQAKQLTKRIRWRSESAEPQYREAAHCMLRSVVNDFFDAASADLSNIDALHKMRIRAKKLRYTMELVAGAFEQPLRRKLYPTFVSVQDQLGSINDCATARVLYAKWQANARGAKVVAFFEQLQLMEEQGLSKACAQFRSWWTPERARELAHQFDVLLATGATEDDRPPISSAAELAEKTSSLPS